MVGTRSRAAEDSPVPLSPHGNMTETPQKRPRANTKTGSNSVAKGPQQKRSKKGTSTEEEAAVDDGGANSVGTSEKPKGSASKRPRAGTTTEETMPADKPTKKKGRKATTTAKVTQAVEVEDGGNEPAGTPPNTVEKPEEPLAGKQRPKKAQRGKKPAEPRDPLPERENRVQNPGFVDVKTGRRTSAKVLEEDRKRDALQQEVEKLKEEKRMMLAQMEINQENEEAEEERTSVKTISDVIRGAQDCEDEDDEYPGADDGTVATEDGGVKASKKARQKKPERGVTRNAVETMKAKIKETSNVNKDRVKRPKHLTGLIAGWSSSSSAGRRVKAGPEIPAAKPTTQLGGLTDDDIVSEPPGASAQKQQWANNLVFVVSDSESPTAEPSPSKAAAQRNSTKKSKPANISTAQSTPVPIKREESASSQPRSISSANSDALLLPRFVQADWIPRFIPTLYHCLLSSDNPFLNFQRGNAEKTIKLVLDTVIPGNTYEVEWEGKLCQMAYERACEMRSKFGRSAMKNIKDFFDGPEYKDKPEAISRYVQWAVRKDGPMLWRVPGPQELPKDPGPEHKPVDIFQSPFIINIVTPTLRCLQASVGHHVFGEPKAAFALATAGLERAFLSFKTGVFCKPEGTFSDRNIGGLVSEYMRNCNSFSTRRWAQLKTACRAVTEAKQEETVVRGFSSLEGSRGTLYIASSPPPEATDAVEDNDD
ncbi:hypothetical protein LshimejAT787_0500040 [Lyophyllum shimeji]|uniref:Uncharacterized protein n=1 Tax=Lyophyllum shimeji TaxID=47721 RepID=A0A9P3UKI1_LYOSH|nr:hypothetical protein LshimejAT787_0500040 [Lyophyllum shimeji]